MEISDAKRLKALEDESPRLKNLLADAHLDIAMLKDVAAKMVTPACRRLHVLLAREGIQINHKKVLRLYRKEGLTVRNEVTGSGRLVSALPLPCSHG